MRNTIRSLVIDTLNVEVLTVLIATNHIRQQSNPIQPPGGALETCRFTGSVVKVAVVSLSVPWAIRKAHAYPRRHERSMSVI